MGAGGNGPSMLLGEYDHALDDKNRLAIPAKFRPAFEELAALAPPPGASEVD